MSNEIWVFSMNGEWRQADDPLASHRHLDDWEKERRAAGYSSWADFPKQDMTPLRLEIYRGQDAGPMPLFLINVSTHSFYETVYADSVPALMELLARWVPAVQGAAVSDLLGQMEENDVVRTLPRRLGSK
ncbi:hypothetical protein ACFXB4_29415 [Streptomyces lavendulae]|uniref:hypothetical protein n=1 Tax=Streptomyces lavendulae TaxID=1914 RepID=UPI003699E7D7